MSTIETLIAALEQHDEARALELIAQGVPLSVQHLQDAIMHGAPEAVVQIAKALPAVTFMQMRTTHWFVSQRQQCEIGTRPLLQGEINTIRDAVEELAGRALVARHVESDPCWLLDSVYEAIKALRSNAAARAIVDRFPQLRDGLLLRAVTQDNQRIAQLMLDAGASADPTDGGRLPDKAPLGTRQIDATKRGYDPLPLHNVRTLGMFELLVAHGADPLAPRRSRTALHGLMASFSAGDYVGHWGKVRVTHGKEIFSRLAQLGVDFAQGFAGRSVMQLAAGLPEALRAHIGELRGAAPAPTSGSSVVSLPSSRPAAMAMA